MKPSVLNVLQMEKAVEILDEMTLAGVSPNEHTYTTIMHGYASLGDTGKAFEYFTKLRNEGLELDVFTYEALLKACCKAGRMQGALAVTKEMSNQKIPRNTFVYNILIDGYELLKSWVYASVVKSCCFHISLFPSLLKIVPQHLSLVVFFFLFLTKRA